MYKRDSVVIQIRMWFFKTPQKEMDTDKALLWQCGKFKLDLSVPKIMGILNVTADSFSDGGDFLNKDAALRQAEQLRKDGADIIDIGGQSTRPGADSISVQEEMDRVLPLVEALSSWDIPISVDTFEPKVMREALAAGASIINDVYGLRKDGALEIIGASDCGVCIMHMQGEPKNMQKNPQYADLLSEVSNFLTTQAKKLELLGVSGNRICLDPGFGFGKTVKQNFELLAEADHFVRSGYPVLYGMSRKSSLGAVTGKENPKDRLISSVTAHLIAVEKGVQIVRVHDAAAMKEALTILNCTQNYKDLG